MLAAVLTSCTGAASPTPTPLEPVPVKIAFLQDLSYPDAAPLVLPAQLAIELAMTRAAEESSIPVVPEVVPLDTGGDDDVAAQIAREVVEDPAYVAAVIAPFLAQPVAAGDALDEAGLATFSLSPRDPLLGGRGWSGWRRVVPDQARQAGSLADAILGQSHVRSGVCMAGDGTGYSDELSDLLRGRLGKLLLGEVILTDPDDVGGTVAQIEASGCRLVAWTGFGAGAALLRAGLTKSGLRGIDLLGADGMKDGEYLTETGGAGDGTVVTCPCVDLSASTRLEAQRFIHDFQAEFGSPPGAYAAEAWDVAGMLLEAFRDGAADRDAVAAALPSDYGGLASSYVFNPSGELAESSARIHTFRAEGLRWVPLGGRRSAELPVRTEGFLTVAGCRRGRPYAYVRGERLLGFEAELTREVADGLGLRLVWADLDCTGALGAVGRGRIDAAIVPSARAAPGTPASRVALSIRVAVVLPGSAAQGADPDGDAVLEGFRPDLPVGVVRDPVALRWARRELQTLGLRLVVVPDRADAYGGALDGRFQAVVDLEHAAWAAIERLPDLHVAAGFDAGEHDVFVGAQTPLLAALDGALAELLENGRYALLFAKYFPGTPVPDETGG